MRGPIASVLALLCGTTLLLLGNGLLGIVLVVRAGAMGFGPLAIGLVMSGYFAGFVIGTFVGPALIRRVGPVRAFAVLAALATVSALLYPLWTAAPAWLLLRLVTGTALAGLCTVIESWLNAQAPPGQRGRVFAAYMIVSLLALAAGQGLLLTQAPGSLVLFSLVAILTALATIPVAMTRLPAPALPATAPLQLRQMASRVPAAFAGAALAGAVLGAFWGLGAAFAEGVGLARAQVAAFMALAVLGGAAMQFPVGRLSDHHDRRSALAAVGLLGALVALAVAWLPPRLGTLGPAFFLLGGLAFSLYPLCMAHLLEHLPAESLWSACSAMLLCNGIGAALGPLMAGAAMQAFGPRALPALMCAGLALLAAIAGGRRLWRVRLPGVATRFHPMLRTTPAALALLPEMAPDPHSPRGTP